MHDKGSQSQPVFKYAHKNVINDPVHILPLQLTRAMKIMLRFISTFVGRVKDNILLFFTRPDDLFFDDGGG